ncbi:MAG: DUF6448 family protein [bacterium]|nr:DUF6448 family protein [bacterium]
MPGVGRAHCDTMDGPVVKDARKALENGDVTPVLKWVQPKDEEAIRAAFQKTLTVRAKGPDACDLADQYFYETLVRLHRAGEGASFEGLKPAGTKLEPGVEEADAALEKNTEDELVKVVTAVVAAGIRERFELAAETRRSASQSIEAGRESVEAYVLFVHSVERLMADAAGTPAHHGAEGFEAGDSGPHHEAAPAAGHSHEEAAPPADRSTGEKTAAIEKH